METHPPELIEVGALIPSPCREELGSAVFLVVIVFRAGWRTQNGLMRTQRYTSLSIAANRDRNQVQRKRDGLLFWASGGMLGDAGPKLLLALIALPLSIFFIRWIANAPDLPHVNGLRVWRASVGPIILCHTWVFVRNANLRAAQAMRRE